MNIIRFLGLAVLGSLPLLAQTVSITPKKARLGNDHVAIEFDLETGTYSGIDLTDRKTVFQDAWYRIGQGGWKEPEYQYKAEQLEPVLDEFGAGKKLRVWYLPQHSYDPARFLDITVYQESPFFVIGWGVKNDKAFTIRVRAAEVLLNGILFADQKCSEPKVLRGGAGAEPNFVESTWEIIADNSAMLTYRDLLAGDKRRTLVAGGLKYAEFMRTVEFHKQGKSRGTGKNDGSFMTLTVHDPQGKRIAPGELWTSKDSFLVELATANPFESLEHYGKSLALANRAHPNAYDFPTLCGWMTSMPDYGDGKPVNHSPALVDQVESAIDMGITKYTPVAVRLEPDYYCYDSEGDTQQGWWDDEHWSKYGSLRPPYETFAKFAGKVNGMGGKVLTYFQGSMPSNDFALAHPDWMLNNDISLLYEDHPHARPFVRYDFTDPGFQRYTLQMWQRLRKDGVAGIKFDYPESGWAKDGGFEDTTYTTVSAYRKIYELCREGLGKDAFIHERIMGLAATGVPRTDCTAGLVDLQRVWADASHFEPEMASRIGLRWYKQGAVFRYYPDGKSFYHNRVALSQTQRRAFLTLIGLLSGRIELGTAFDRLGKEMVHDLTRFYPVLPNGKSFRPVDLLLDKKHPEIYVFDVSSEWKQVIFVNNDTSAPQWISAPISGDQTTTGSIGFDPTDEYLVFDFWKQKPLGVFPGKGCIRQLLDKGEAAVFALKRLKSQPQIMGTNRHVMCGMVELENEAWDAAGNQLTFDADIIAGETMNITIHLPEDKQMRVETISVPNTESSYSTNGNILTLSIFHKTKSMKAGVTVRFAP